MHRSRGQASQPTIGAIVQVPHLGGLHHDDEHRAV
jgi:hypothetical protein